MHLWLRIQVWMKMIFHHSCKVLLMKSHPPSPAIDNVRDRMLLEMLHIFWTPGQQSQTQQQQQKEAVKHQQLQEQQCAQLLGEGTHQLRGITDQRQLQIL
uniref:Uncharacterized protein n=1 Tax=Nothobranchius kadleci TaxID=1051664 RepID=A0A1A8DLK0_NOTKA